MLRILGNRLRPMLPCQTSVIRLSPVRSTALQFCQLKPSGPRRLPAQRLLEGWLPLGRPRGPAAACSRFRRERVSGHDPRFVERLSFVRSCRSSESIRTPSRFKVSALKLLRRVGSGPYSSSLMAYDAARLCPLVYIRSGYAEQANDATKRSPAPQQVNGDPRAHPNGVGSWQ